MLLQRQAPSLRPLTTAHLAQTMTLLELNAAELRQKVDAALAGNPALELVEEHRCPTCKRLLPGRMPCPICSAPPGASAEQPVVFVSSRDDFQVPGPRTTESQYGDDELPLAAVENLPEYVLRQVAAELSPTDRHLAAHILTNLDEDGLLLVPVVEIARYHHVLISAVEKVVRQIQRADPVGVASSSPQQALLVQLDVLGETQAVHPRARQVIEQGLELLSRRRYAELASRIGITIEQARQAAEFIRQNLNPYPARAHWGEVSAANMASGGSPYAYYNPDVIIHRLNDQEDTPLIVEVALPVPGTLQVNPLFRQALSDAPPEKVEAWKSDLEQASLLVKCLQQRNHTLVRLMRLLSIQQRDYILYGNAHMKPLTRAALSQQLEVHESTISRAVSTKTVQLPNRRIVPMAVFFDRSLHIRTALIEIVEREKRPLSDSDLQARLAQQGFRIARRTVAKYRSMEGILPAYMRKPEDIILCAQAAEAA